MGRGDRKRNRAGRWRLLGAVAALALTAAGPAAADDRQLICQTITAAAVANGLPEGFLARLLWTESGFRSGATSPAGAAGIAQFMPQTAAERGLVDPRDPLQSIGQAARLLVDLDREFGNLGLAAAAYNAGSARVVKWLQGLSPLPVQTRLYVLAITGRPPEDWAALRGGLTAQPVSYPLPGLDCFNAAAPARRTLEAMAPAPIFEVRLDKHLTGVVALFDAVARGEAPAARMRGAKTSAAADSLCAALRAEGAACQVFGR